MRTAGIVLMSAGAGWVAYKLYVGQQAGVPYDAQLKRIWSDQGGVVLAALTGGLSLFLKGSR